MAAVTASSKAAASLTPPSSSHGNQVWNYAVPADTPVDDITSYYTAVPPNKSNTARSRKGSFPIAVKGRSVSIDNTNATTKQNGHNKGTTNVFPSNHDIIGKASNPDLLAPRVPLSERQISNQSTGGDSVIDLYNSRSGNNTIINESYPNVNSSLTAMYDLSGDVDNTEGSRWIYRDKLLRIENQEKGSISPASAKSGTILQENRSNSNMRLESKTMEAFNHERSAGKGFNDPEYDSNTERAFDNGDFDLRLPEEKENDMSPISTNRQLSRATSYSRIPLATSSPAPVPQEYIERVTPLHRPESAEYEEDLENIYNRSTRKRSQSTGSSILLEPERPLQPVTPTPQPQGLSAPKVRTGKQAITPSPRRPSSANKNSNFSHNKSRSRSQPGPGRLPSGTSTSTPGQKAPEGPPPWALSSYSPDPKLPPDQQLIPTVAKRLQQEQWEREGLYASVYDRELRPLKVHDDDVDGAQNAESSTKEKGNQWPLGKQPTLAPIIQDPPPRTETVMQPIRVQDPGDDEGKQKKSKGCCCIIM